MMDRVEWYVNMIYYNIFKFDSMLHRTGNKILDPLVRPFRFLSKLSDKEIDNAEESMFDPQKGFVIVHAKFDFGILCVLYCGSLGFIMTTLLFSLLELTSEQHFYFSFSGLPVGVILSLWVDKIFLEKNNNYLAYFKEFKKWNLGAKRKWAIVTFIIFLIGIGLFVSALLLFAYFGRKIS